MDDDDPALGMKVRIILLVTVVLLVVGSVSPALLNSKGVEGIVLDKGVTTNKVVKDVGAKSGLINKPVPKENVISGTFKPSIKRGYAYKWYKRSWINYCPGCHRYGTLINNPKGVYEGEITCSKCDADFCGVTGTDKGYGRRWSLRRA